MKSLFFIAIWVAYLFSAILLFNANNVLAQDIDAYVQKANLLAEQGEIDIAREILIFGYQETGDLSLLENLLLLDEEVVKVLNLNLKDSLTIWEPANKSFLSFFKVNFKDGIDIATDLVKPGWWSGSSWSEKGLNMILGPGGLFVKGFLKKADYNREEAVSDEKKHPIQIELIDKATANLDTFENIKKSQAVLEKLIKKAVIETNDKEDLQKLTNFLKKQTQFKENLIDIRSKYVSYNLVSPSVARVQQLLFISENEKFMGLGHTDEYFSEIAKALSSIGTKDILLSANEDSKYQYIETRKILKEMASASELEDIQVFETFSDKTVLEPNPWW
jgi:hypothetical protein